MPDPTTPNKALDDELVMTLVELALGRPQGEREAYLRRACGGDTGLFTQVWNYVEWDDRMSGFLLEPLFPQPEPEHPFAAGDLLRGRFRIVREVARGGMGIVYEARDEKLDRRIALKCAKTGFHKRLPPEVRNASEVSHPNVCKIHEIHTASVKGEDIDFLTMEFLDGRTLGERLAEGPLPEQEARMIAEQLSAGLAEAHRNAVVHGDLKSTNIILTTAADGSVRGVITDFGLARRPQSAQPGIPSDVVGTPDYMAPELWKGEKASLASDVYALGVILCELACGRRPFGPDVSMEDRLTRKPPAIRHQWNRIVARCLDPDPAKRYRHAGEVVEALEPPQSRRWLLTAAAAIVAAVMTGVVAYRSAIAPGETIQLAVLPFETDAGTAELSDGILVDTGDRLRTLKADRKRLTVIPLSDATQNKVTQPAKAHTVLGAAYALHGTMRQEHGRLLVAAYLTDAQSLVHLKEWRGEYAANELENVPVALAGIVTGTLHLPPLAVAATVNPAAYADYAAGVALSRRNSGVDRALPYLERAAAADPGSPLTHARLAEAQFQKHRQTRDPHLLEQATISLQNAERRNPDIAVVRFVSGLIQEFLGQYESAETDFLRAIAIEPSNGDAWRRLAKVYEKGNQPRKAREAFQKALGVQPEYFKNYQDLANFYFSRGEYEDAVREAKNLVQLAPDLAEAHYMLAAPYLNLGRFADAEYELDIALKYQETINAVEGLGLLRWYQGRDRDAIPYFERALKIGPPVSSVYYMNLGSARRRADMARESAEAYRQGRDLAGAVLAQNPHDGFERSCLAYLCARLGDRTRAQTEIGQALSISGQAINVRWVAVQTYEVLGRRDRALELIRDVPATVLSEINRLPDLADLSADPRFKQLLAARQTP